MMKGVYLSLMALIFMATNVVAESQLVGDDCVAAVKKECGGHGGTKLTDMLTLQCKNRQSELKCEELKQTSKDIDKAKFASCSDPKHLCEATDTGDKLYSCGAGVGGVIYNIAYGFYMIGPALFELAKNIKEPGVFANCYDNTDAKLAYMGDLRPKDMTDESIQKASCVDIQKFTKEKAKVILAKIETRRQDEMIKTGNENLTPYDLKLSEAELQALNFDLAHAGILKKAQCFTAEEAVKVVCAEMTKMAIVAGSSAATGVAKLVKVIKATSNSRKALEAARVAETQKLQVAKAIEKNSETHLGKPYVGGPLGEGSKGIVSAKPLICDNKFDCVTYVETVMAQSLSKAPEQILPNLIKIRYADGKVSYIKRNHFTDLDWIPNLTKSGVIEDVTRQVAGMNTRTVTASVDRGQWLRNQDNVKTVAREGLTDAQKEIIMQRLKTASGSYKPTSVAVDYIPINTLVNNAQVVSQIPSGTVFSIVRDSTSWVIGGKRVEIGTVISHQGFVVHKNGVAYLRNASSLKDQMKVVDIPLVEYMKSLPTKNPDIVGLNIQRLTGSTP